MLDLALVILNWNTRDLLRDCLRSVYASQGDVKFQVCVVDNASADGSADMVRAEFPQTQVIANATNLGYPAGNNVGLRAFGFGASSTATLPRFALLLNPDTVLPPTALAEMLAYMERQARCGAAGPKLILPDGQLDLACRRSFPTPEISFYRMVGLSRLFPYHPRFGRYNLTYLHPDVETEVDSVVGAFMLVRGEAIAQAGLMDETFWMYGEDLDWAFAIKQAGWQVRYNPAVTVLHVKRAASRMSSRAQIAFYESMLLFYHKHYAAHTPLPLGWAIVTGIRLSVGWTKLREQFTRRAAPFADAAA